MTHAIALVGGMVIGILGWIALRKRYSLEVSILGLLGLGLVWTAIVQLALPR